jgi:hypothetical protein
MREGRDADLGSIVVGRSMADVVPKLRFDRIKVSI